ncbi:hypothetical protein Hanom_Chr06g00514231 [Helianthus anomalus]
MQLDLNIPVEDSYAQHNYSNYGHRGEPYPQVEYPYSQPTYPDHGYSGEQSSIIFLEIINYFFYLLGFNT